MWRPWSRRWGVHCSGASPAGATLTSDGRTFLPHARAVLVTVGQAVESVRRTRRIRCGVDVLGNRLATSAVLLDFHRAHQDIPLKTVMLNGVDAAVRALAAGEIDAAFVYARDPIRGISCPSSTEPSPVWRPWRSSSASGTRSPEPNPSARPNSSAPFTAWVAGDRWRAANGVTGIANSPRRSRSPSTRPARREASVWRRSSNRSAPRVRSSPSSGRGVRISICRDSTGSARIPVVAPTPVYPWSLVWHSANPHPGLAALVAHVRRGSPSSDTTGLWLPRPFRENKGCDSRRPAGAPSRVTATRPALPLRAAGRTCTPPPAPARRPR